MSIPPSSIERMDSKVWFKSLREETKEFSVEELAESRAGSKVSHRFQDIKCPKSTLVGEEAVLFDKKILHANRVRMIDGSDYILTQAPEMVTRELLWKTCMSNGSKLILDLTNENDRTKDRSVINYYPEDQGAVDEMGSIKITCTEKEQNGEMTTSTYTVVDSQKGQTEVITRVHYESWEDHGATACNKLHHLIAHIDSIASKVLGPVTVHCRAGVGRTGSFVTARTLKKLMGQGQLSEESFKEITSKIILAGREQRGPYFVQTPAQLQGIIEFAQLIMEKKV